MGPLLSTIATEHIMTKEKIYLQAIFFFFFFFFSKEEKLLLNQETIFNPVKIKEVFHFFLRYNCTIFLCEKRDLAGRETTKGWFGKRFRYYLASIILSMQ